MSIQPSNHFAHITAQGYSRQHNGHVYIEQQNNYQHPDATKGQNATVPDLSLRDALAFRRMDFRSASVTTAFPNTCQWLFETPEYKRWLDADMQEKHHGLLWIKGNPGAGKSTIMKCAARHASESHTDQRVLSFFFNARGEYLEKSIQGMYRALLHQVASEFPASQEPIPTTRLLEYREHGWPIELMKDLFRTVMHHLGRIVSLVCFIDALDEGTEDDIRDVVHFFQELGNTAYSEAIQFRVCFASRHYPRISVKNCEELVLDGQRGHQDDITEYVRHNLSIEEQQLTEHLASQIREKSLGVFLWVVLAVAMLNKECDQGNFDRLEAQLHAVPADLRALLDDIVTKGSQDKRLLNAAQWVLFSPEPLDDEQVYFAIKTSIGELSAAQTAWDRSLITESAIERFVLDSTKGLIEIRHGRAQFIHESVRQYFSEFGLRRLDPDMDEGFEAASHERLAHWCQKYLRHVPIDASLFVNEEPGHESKKLRQAIRNFPVLSFPFTKQAMTGSFYHAETASARGRRQDAFLMGFPCEQWILLAWTWDALFEERRTWTLHPLGVTLLHLLTILGHVCLVEDELEDYALRPAQEKEDYVNAECSLGSSLDLAFQKEHWELHELLLRNGAKLDSQYRLWELDLAAAMQQQNTDTFRLLLERGTTVNVHEFRINLFLIKLLDEAMLSGYHDAVRLLLDHGVGSNEIVWLGLALRRAIFRGHHDIVRVLLEHNEHWSFEYLTIENALADAIKLDDEGILRSLLQYRRGRCIPGSPQRWSPLVVDAAKLGRTGMVEILLEHGEDVNATDMHGDFALIKAMRDGHTDTFELLLKHGADANTSDGFSQSILQLAIEARKGHRFVQLLLEHGADPYRSMGDFGNALEYAEVMGQEDVKQILHAHVANHKPSR